MASPQLRAISVSLAGSEAPRAALRPNDYMFPTLGMNGILVHPERPIMGPVIQKKINKTAEAAGISGATHFTTHCFHQGGAQYSFQFAPLGQHWTLAHI